MCHLFVSGSIDEVDQQVSMTWVQPRVLDMGQVGRAVVSSTFILSLYQVTSIRDRVADWCGQVKSTINLAKDSAPEVATIS